MVYKFVVYPKLNKGVNKMKFQELTSKPEVGEIQTETLKYWKDKKIFQSL